MEEQFKEFQENHHLRPKLVLARAKKQKLVFEKTPKSEMSANCFLCHVHMLSDSVRKIKESIKLQDSQAIAENRMSLKRN